MAQIRANPWSFTNADQASSFAISSIVNQGESLLVTSAAHGLTIGSSGTPISLQGAGIGDFAGGYRTLTVPSATTVLVQNQMKNRPLAGTGATGNLLTPVAYMGGNIRAEQIFWQPSAASQTLLLTDLFGNIVWNPISGATTPVGPFTYGKIFWIANGLVINTLPATGYVQITVN